MFGAIFKFELKQGFKRPLTYIFFGVYLLLSLMLGFGMTGVFGTTQQDSLTTLNSAVSVANILVGLNGNILGLLNGIVLVSIMATAIQKDYQYNTHALFFTKPITKAQYFFGRFLAALVMGLFVMSGIIIGYALGLIPGIGTSLLGPFDLMNFLQPFLIFTVPNTIIMGVIFFSLTTFSRNTLAAYMSCIIILIGRFIAENIAGNMDYAFTAALLEPFGSNAFGYIIKYWMAAEKNVGLVPFEGTLLYNRALWMGIALLVMVISYWRFSFTQFLTPFSLFKKKYTVEETPDFVERPLSEILVAKQEFSSSFSWRQLGYLAKFEFRKIISSTFFIISAALALVMIGVIYYYSGKVFDTESYPLTQNVINYINAYSLLANIFVIFYAGTVVFRERDNKVDELIYSTPVNNLVLYFSKFIGLLGAIVLLQFFAVLMGIGIQLSQGFYHIVFGVYLVNIFIFGILSYIVTIGICLAMQVLAPNKYLGFFFSLVPLMLLGILFGLLEWDDKLYDFASNGPKLPYSSLNGFGPLAPSFIFHGYWIFFVLVMSLFSLYFFARGKEKGLLTRFRFSKKEVKPGAVWAIVFAGIAFLGFGGYIFYNTHVLNEYVTEKQRVKEQVEYEKNYSKYSNLLQPRIVEANVNVDIFPRKGSLHVNGFYWLKNKHNAPLDTVLLNYYTKRSDFYYKTLTLSVPSQKVVEDQRMGLQLLKLNTPLAPGDSIKLSFEFDYAPKGFGNSEISSMVVENGTFFNNSIMPSLGYEKDAELRSNAERKKFGLKSKPRMNALTDTAAYGNTYISDDADWIRFETTVSTSSDQTAIAPGYLISKTTKDNRNYFHYKMDNPILNFYAYQSARYEILRDKWENVSLEIYYDKAHAFNVKDMMFAMKQSLAYYSKNFSPYQFRQLRIIEFPAFASFAQSFANTIPFSESIGFTTVVDTSDKGKIDMPFYITSHEVAHQWWAHQVIGANVQGATLMSESMSQYGALMVMEHRYGKDNMKKFLKHEMDGYLKARTFDGKGEMPIMLVENQQYIHYEKGSVIMYALKDYLGEDVLNQALRKYVSAVAFQEPPYTTSAQFVATIREATPDSLKYIIRDFFEEITLYENYVKNLKYTKLPSGKYKVSLTVGSVKFHSDKMGNNKKVELNDYIDIGVFGKVTDKTKDYNPLILQKFKIDAPEKTFEFIVDQEPIFAGIDPYNKLIDRTPDNNVCNFGITPKIPNLTEKENKFINVGGKEED